MPRLPKPSGGRTFSRTCLIRGREAEGRWAILKPGPLNTSVARIGPDGLTTDERDKVSTTEVVDIRPVTASPPVPVGPVAGVVGDRGTVTLPADLRRYLRLQPGSPILIEERGGEIVIRPADIVPRRSGADPTLDALLAGVTAENRHDEVPTGPAIGREDW